MYSEVINVVRKEGPIFWPLKLTAQKGDFCVDNTEAEKAPRDQIKSRQGQKGDFSINNGEVEKAPSEQIREIIPVLIVQKLRKNDRVIR